ncbi:3-phosphoinositide-dependent protein kinase 1-related [Anaeramoeba flamelloides]|uniref:non-specific serine/threonine protein kinase n=1 Tax=Anaeramoeba flamelloides TaxID=1746091 RepID=A0ABQ8X9Q9_9EUKA|nr:3-phosphoinositide-dependent protein kinase 1-related [Anaeramoeba flamelloides]
MSNFQMNKPQKSLKNFEMGESIGRGAFGDVSLLTDKQTREKFAVKILNKQFIEKMKKQRYVQTEKEVLKLLDHPNIIKIIYEFEDEENLYIVNELCPKGDLYDIIRKYGSINLKGSKFILAEILSALEHIHSHNIIHRDLKPENILLSETNHVKIIDFGTSKFLQENQQEKVNSGSFCGTAEYVSPEMLKEKIATKESDLWAFGCIVYQLFAGRPPFRASNEFKVFQKILKREFTFPRGFPQPARDLVSKLIVINPQNRLGAGSDFESIKKHPLFEGISFKNLYKMKAPRLQPHLPTLEMTNPEREKEKKKEKILRNNLEKKINNNHNSNNKKSGSSISGEGNGNNNEENFLNFEQNLNSNNQKGKGGEREKKKRNRNRKDEDEDEDEEVDESEYQGIDPMRVRLLKEQKKRIAWTKFLVPNELIIELGLVSKKQGLFQKKMQLLLTDFPRFIYFDPKKIVKKGEIGWSSGIKVEIINLKKFSVTTLKKTYVIEDLEGNSQKWKDAVERIVESEKVNLESRKMEELINLPDEESTTDSD